METKGILLHVLVGTRGAYLLYALKTGIKGFRPGNIGPGNVPAAIYFQNSHHRLLELGAATT